MTEDSSSLELASVVLLKTDYASQVDSNGYFKISAPPGKYQLRVSYIGYENYQTEVIITGGENTSLNISMIPLTSKLKEVVVTGSMKEVRKSESVIPVDVYTMKYFDRNPVNNLFEALQNVNGLFADVDNGVANTSDVQINGLEGNYTMYLIDGVPALNGLAGVYALNGFPMSIIDKVEILKGASSTLYGSEAIAGVINIKTKNPSDIPKFSMNVSLTSMLEAHADFAVKYKVGKADAMLAVSGESFNMRWDINKDGFLDIPLINSINVFNKWSMPRADHKVANFYLRYLYEDRFGGDKTMPSAWRGSSRYYSEAITTNQWQAGLQWALPGKENFLFQADYSEHRQNAYYGFNQYQGIQVSGFTQLTWRKKVKQLTEFLVGAVYRLSYMEDNSPLSADSLTGYKRLVHLPGIFFDNEWYIARGHVLSVGARLDYSTRSKFVATPRLNYKWNSKDDKNIIRFGAGTGYRVPNLLNEGFGALNGSRSIVVEGELKPEYAVNVNLNYTRVQELKGGLLNIDVSGFYTWFSNYIEPDYEEDPSLIIYSNNKGATAAGFSVNADFTFNYPLKVGVGFTYTNVFELDENDEGEMEKEVPLHQPPFVANFFFSYNFPVPQLSIDWTGNFVAPMKLAVVPNDYRSSKSPFFSIQNIQLTKKFKKGVQLYLGLKNIFNFIQKDPILRPFDPYNRDIANNNPYGYHFDTTYGFTTTQGIKAFVGFRYVIP